MSNAATRLKGLADSRLVLVFLGILLLGGVFTAGIVWSSLDNVDKRRQYLAAIEETRRMEERNAELVAANEDLATRIARFERQLQVNQIAYDELTAELRDSSNTIGALKEELDFYRSIISPKDNTAGVRIQGFQVRQVPADGSYRYKLTIVQSLDHERTVAGSATIRVEGRHRGVDVSFPMSQLGEAPGELSFRYFQVVEGGFSLPDEFDPSAVTVRVVSTAAGKSKKEQAEQRFDWIPGQAVSG